MAMLNVNMHCPNPHKWIHWIDNFDCEKVAVMSCVLVIAEKALLNKELNTYIPYSKKQNLNSKN